MARLLYMPTVQALVLDLDNTMYRCPEYLDDGHHGELMALSQVLGIAPEAVKSRIHEVRVGIQKDSNQISVGRGQSVLAMGLSIDWWNSIRNNCYHPEKFLRPWPGVAERLSLLLSKFKISIVSNSPTNLTHRVLQCLGLGDLVEDMVVLGGDDASLPKPSSELYEKTVALLGIDAKHCLSIGDRVEFDGWPAMRIGMGAVVVEGMQDLIDVLDGLIQGFNSPTAPLQETGFDLSRLLAGWYRPGEVNIGGMTGQAGSGKTATAYLLQQLARERGVPCRTLSLDYFFRLSSQERRRWLNEGKRIGDDAYIRRSNQMNWWDFDRLGEALDRLRRGDRLHLQGVYNRADGGELTGEVDIQPESNGMVIVLEGVAIAHLRDQFHHLVHLHAPREIRFERLKIRDPHRTGPEAEARFELTETFERGYFADHIGRANLFVENGNGFPVRMPAPPTLAEL